MDKGPNSSLAMFWAAVDVLKVRVAEERTDEAHKILLALERMLPHVLEEGEGRVQEAYSMCQSIFESKTRERRTKPAHLQTGIWGEELATVFLRDKGYVILERDWRSGHQDIDIIARDGNTIVFVEVKARRNTVFGDPIMAVNYQKRKNLIQAMNHYIKQHHIDDPVRFDIITIVGTPACTHPEITHVEDVSLI